MSHLYGIIEITRWIIPHDDSFSRNVGYGILYVRRHASDDSSATVKDVSTRMLVIIVMNGIS